jgi:hypothetical protein
MVDALTVRPASALVAWNNVSKSGSTGCVAYRSRNVQKPANEIASIPARLKPGRVMRVMTVARVEYA